MRITKKVKEKVRAMKSAGYSVFEIAQHFGLTESDVVNIIELGLQKKKVFKKKK